MPNLVPRLSSGVSWIWLFAVTAVVLTMRVGLEPVGTAALPLAADPQTAGAALLAQLPMVRNEVTGEPDGAGCGCAFALCAINNATTISRIILITNPQCGIAPCVQCGILASTSNNAGNVALPNSTPKSANASQKP